MEISITPVDLEFKDIQATVVAGNFPSLREQIFDKMLKGEIDGNTLKYNSETRQFEAEKFQYIPGTNIRVIIDERLKPGEMYLR